MAVYTDVSDTELAAFLGAFELGGVLAFKGIAEGVENSNFFLKTERGSYILTLYEKRVREEDLPFFLGLLEHLSAKGIQCPLPVRARDGRTWRTLAGRPAAVMTFLSGLSPKRPDAQQCAEVGAALARLHMAGADYGLTRANALSLEGWKPLVKSCERQANGVRMGLAALIDSELRWLEQHWPAGLPQGLIHADLFPDNVFFIEGRLSGLIDFYFACNDAYAYDLAVCLNAWCFEPDGTFNITKGRALLSTYRTVRPLAPVEVAALPVLARGAAFRFLLTRLYDWINRDAGALVRPKDPVEYLTKLRFHQTALGAASYGWPE
ncbi:MAG: homoserine kinase [Alphaproteobacteria bacterium]|nr:homoserine kinase [Alphaproteobacteria bacterium]